jgi:molybdopterin/thiamine biosynthesis adenylyltransferase
MSTATTSNACTATASMDTVAIRAPTTEADTLRLLPPEEAVGQAAWSYEEAFARNLGLINPKEQQRLRRSHVAIVGMGGVGGIHLTTLARLGIGQFTIADPDTFETVNFNRQFGATLDNIGRSKAEVMAEQARSINPELELRVFNEAISAENVADFLSGVDVLVDGIDFFNIEARRLVFREAQARGIWAVTAGPIGFSTAWLVFDPHGMSFDRYFDLHDGMDRLDQLIAFAVGLTPRATHVGYLDVSQVNPDAATGPSAALACRLAAGVAGAEVIKVLLGRNPEIDISEIAVAATEVFKALFAPGLVWTRLAAAARHGSRALKILLARGGIRPAPCYFQFDAYRQVLRKGRLRWGNRHPWQRLKRYVLHRRILKLVDKT